MQQQWQLSVVAHNLKRARACGTSDATSMAEDGAKVIRTAPFW